jgi:geranylgeranyl reductase family protein
VACRLAALGHQVVVLDRKHEPGQAVCCTGIVGQECVRAFAIEDDVILSQASSARLFSPNGNSLHVWREEPQASILDRAAFNRAMAGRARSRGAEYVLDCPVWDIEVAGDAVRVSASSQGDEVSVLARAAVIATGFGSGLVEKLGLGYCTDSVSGAQVEVETTVAGEVEVYFGREVAPGFFAWLVPTSPQSARVGLMSHRSPAFYLERLLLSLKEQGRVTSITAEPSFGGIPLKPLRRTYAERVLVVGSAAGQVKPTTGGGIYYGLLCADIAAGALHQALRGDDLSAKSLSWYEREWRRRLGHELQTGYWSRKLFERLSDRRLDRLFDIIANNRIDEALLRDKDVSFDWHSRAIMALLGRAAVAGAIGRFRLPSRARKDI